MKYLKRSEVVEKVLKIGSRIRLNNSCSRAYAGVEGTVTNFRDGMFWVEYDFPVIEPDEAPDTGCYIEAPYEQPWFEIL